MYFYQILSLLFSHLRAFVKLDFNFTSYKLFETRLHVEITVFFNSVLDGGIIAIKIKYAFDIKIQFNLIFLFFFSEKLTLLLLFTITIIIL